VEKSIVLLSRIPRIFLDFHEFCCVPFLEPKKQFLLFSPLVVGLMAAVFATFVVFELATD